MSLEKQKISIGLPVYNAESIIEKRIDGILSQTFQDFELVISDNASTDSTQRICNKYVKKDSRIRFFQQGKNIGWHKNFKFVLEKARYEFFIWTAASDIWDETFLEKNFKILQKNPNVVGSISKMVQYGEQREERELSNNNLLRNIIKKSREYFSKYGTFNAKGRYEERIRKYLSVRSAESIYALYRTNAIKKSFVDELISAVDLAMILNVLKFGEIEVIDEILFQDYTGGTSSRGIIVTYKNIRKSKIEFIFPYYSFTKWSYKTLGRKIFFRNLDNFFSLNLAGFLATVYDIIIKRK